MNADIRKRCQFRYYIIKALIFDTTGWFIALPIVLPIDAFAWPTLNSSISRLISIYSSYSPRWISPPRCFRNPLPSKALQRMIRSESFSEANQRIGPQPNLSRLILSSSLYRFR